jgi:hypothetical protein
MVNYDKPLTLSLLAYILWLIALIIITASVYTLFYGEKFFKDGILQFIESDSMQLYILIGFGLLMIFAGVGILTASSGGRVLLIILSIVVVIHGLFVLMEDTIPGIIIMVIGAWILLYMLSSRVADVFSPIDSRKTVNALETLESYRKSRNL